MIRLFYLVCCIFASCLVAQQPPTYKLLGETVTLDPFGIPISPDDILWKHEGNKVVEFNGNEQTVYGTFDNRITLDWVSAELTISDLRHEDSGVYALEAYTKQEMKRASFKLEVIDKVSKPTISCVMNNGSSSTESGIQATLRCSAEARLSPSLMKFEWKSNGKTQLGENLIIPLGDGRDDEVYDCTVSNTLTKESTTFTAKDCYPNEGSAGLAAGICAAIIAAILIILGVVFCKLKQKACFAKENRHDVEKQKGSENKPAQDDEHTPFLRRESTLPSKQRLGPQQDINSQNNLDKDDQQIPPGTVRGLVKGFEEYGVENNAAGLEKGKRIRAALPLDFGVDSVKEGERDPLDSTESNNVSGDESENKNSDLQPTIVSDQQGAEEKGDEETKSPPAAGVHLPAAEPHLLVTENSQNPSPQDGSGENEDQTVSNQKDQDTTGNNEGDPSEPEEGKEPEDLNKKSPEENIKIQAVPPGPLESAENSEENPDIYSSREPPEEERDPSDSEKSNDASGDTSDLQPTTASEQPGAEEEAGATQPLVPVTGNSQNQSPQEGSGEHEGQTVSDQKDQDTTGNNEGDPSEREGTKQPEDLMRNRPSVSVKEQRKIFEPNNKNPKAKGSEDKQIPAVTSGPQDSPKNDKGDADVESPKESAENKDPPDSNKPNVVSDDKSENTESDQQPPAASEHPGSEDKLIPAVTSGPQDSPKNDKGDADVGSPKESAENKDPPDSNKPNVVSDDKSENTESDQQTTTASEHPGLEEDKPIPAVTSGPQDSLKNDKGDAAVESPKESAENKDPPDSNKPNVVSDDKSENTESDQQTTTASEPPASPLTQDASNTVPEDGADKPEKDSSSDQVTGGTTDLSQGGSDLSSEEENESNNHSDVKDNPTISDQKDPETTGEQYSKQDETRQEDKQQETGNSEDNHDSNSENEQEKIDQKKKPPPVLPKKPQSFKTPKPDN